MVEKKQKGAGRDVTSIHPRDVGLANPRRLGKPRRAGKPSDPPEATIQAHAEAYADLLGIPRLHIPAILLRAAFAPHGASGGELWALRNAAAEVGGFPDLVLFRGGRFLAMEFKRGSNKMTASQRRWADALGTIECRSFEAAKAEIDRWRQVLENKV